MDAEMIRIKALEFAISVNKDAADRGGLTASKLVEDAGEIFGFILGSRAALPQIGLQSGTEGKA